MPYTAEQKKLILGMFNNAREAWYYDSLRWTIYRHLQKTGFTGLIAGDMYHVDPDKVKKDRFANYLWNLKLQCDHLHRSHFEEFQKLEIKGKETGLTSRAILRIMNTASHANASTAGKKVKKIMDGIRIQFEMHDKIAKPTPVKELERRLTTEISDSSRRDAEKL